MDKKSGNKDENKTENPHAGHRKRMWDKYSSNGIKAFADHELLEMLLYLVLPRVNTNVIGHELIKKFKSIGNILKADPDDIAAVNGIGKTSAVQLRFLGDLFFYIHKTKRPSFALRRAADAVEYCTEYFRDMSCECISYFLMDDEMNVIFHDDIISGSGIEVDFSLKKIMRQAIKYDCTKLLLAHNHPQGDIYPSNVDIITTNRIGNIMRSIDIEVIDHIIIKDGQARSMRESGECAGFWG